MAPAKGRDPLVAQAKWRDSLVSQMEGRDPLVTQADLSVSCVCSPAVALLHKNGPCHRRKICTKSLRLISYYTQSSRVEE